MKPLMIITSYYPPEIGAASNRIHHLAVGLKNDYAVHVITPLPNYPTGKIFSDYKGKFSSKPEENGITINRLWIYASVSKNKFLRLIAMLSYSFSLIWFFMWHKIPEKVIVQSPPLLVAFTCMFFLKSKKRKLILNVSDLWPSAGLELGALKDGFSYKMLKKLEAFNYKKADLILGQSNEILTHVKTITSKPELFLYRNFPEIEFPKLEQKEDSNNKTKMVYAGLLGVAQGIHKLCKEIDYTSIEFHIYGSGAEEEAIKTLIASNKNLPLYFHGRVNRGELHKELLHYDLTIIPLLNRIYGSVPSKIFEYAKLGLPMLYFGGGEGETIIEKNNLGWVANEGDYRHLNVILNSISLNDLKMERKQMIQQKAKVMFDFGTQLEELKKIL
ncbi:glycosyltransferase family 4 protein [Winogradskyella bathintestinalis]|uniref:Glycosyltransferase family 4 protein n=1 Tax=Winogradskyella bathintestinalis TaxID=3035208 RepID=A0ABT7ZRH8_9FLAO|nr:glycosyltransferase family 4 protein [Winogradskyella bathintestinalis]MDN3491591.1 glycosyltransferase family 4 protein [Winogradskyella bathintestinalis]